MTALSTCPARASKFIPHSRKRWYGVTRPSRVTVREDVAPATAGIKAEDWQYRLSLDGNSESPLYAQLLEQINLMIETGVIAPGTTLPSERDLSEFLNVSRITVKRCYDELRHRQLILRRGRLGSIVREHGRLLPGMDRLKGFTEEMRLLKKRPSSRILERRVVNDPLIASIFGREPDSSFLKLLRVRSGDGVPLSLENAWYDLGVLPGLHSTRLVGGSVYRTVREIFGIRLAYCEQTVEAVSSNQGENAVFGFVRATPCLKIKRRTYADDDRMIEYVEGLFRGDLYTYRLTLKI